MLLRIDRAGVEKFAFRTSSTEYGDVRRYYCARAPLLAIVVCRHGLDLNGLIGDVVDAQVGSEKAWRDFARPGCQGRRHTRITIYRRARGDPARSLSQLLAAAACAAAG